MTAFSGGPQTGKETKEVPAETCKVLEVRRYISLGKPTDDLRHYESAFYTEEGRYIGRLCTCGSPLGHGDNW